MRTKLYWMCMLACTFVLASAVDATAQDQGFEVPTTNMRGGIVQYGRNPEVGKLFTHDKVRVYYEVYGSGKPLVILHGNGGSIAGRSSFIEEYSKKYRVIAMDNRCHGKSDCPQGKVVYEQMAEDISKILSDLKIDSAYFWGHSDGAIIGLMVAINYPGKIKKLLASGSNLRPDSTAVVPEAFPLVAMIRKTLKDSVGWKQFKLLTEQPHIPVTDLHKIKADVLVMAGDRDIIRNEHTLEICQNIPGALLCILPGTTHMVFEQRRKWFTDILYDFLDKPPFRKTTVQIMMSH